LLVKLGIAAAGGFLAVQVVFEGQWGVAIKLA